MLKFKKIAVFFYVVLFLTQFNFCGDEIAFKVKTAIVIDRALGEFINNLAMRDFGHKNSSISIDSGYDSDVDSSDLDGFVVIK